MLAAFLHGHEGMIDNTSSSQCVQYWDGMCSGRCVSSTLTSFSFLPCRSSPPSRRRRGLMCCLGHRSFATTSDLCGHLLASLAQLSLSTCLQVLAYAQGIPQHDVGDNLMLHVAMYEAPPGSVVVVQSGDLSFAAIGGNVARIAKERGIAGLVLDGVVRDIAEIRALEFPVFARGIVPVPGTKTRRGLLNQEIVCGDVKVRAGDVIVADEEGIIAVPHAESARFLEAARKRQAKEESEGYETWKQNHRARLEASYYSHL